MESTNVIPFAPYLEKKKGPSLTPVGQAPSTDVTFYGGTCQPILTSHVTVTDVTYTLMDTVDFLLSEGRKEEAILLLEQTMNQLNTLD